MDASTKTIITFLVLATTVSLQACASSNPGNQSTEMGTPHATGERAHETDQSQQTLQVAQSFLAAVGTGDMETMRALMAEDFVWRNEGDPAVPWIGNWQGRDTVFNEFLPAFGAGLETTGWTTDHSIASGDQAAFFGTMSATATNSGAETGTFNWALRVHVADGKIQSWNWFEDSFAVSRAYNAASAR